MSHSIHKTFNSAEMNTLKSALTRWCAEKGIHPASVEAELSAAALVNMYREGNQSEEALLEALRRHKSLSAITIDVLKAS